MAKKEILVATRSIRGGTKSASGVKPHELKPQEELTTDRQKALGLTANDVDDLVESGALLKIPAHVSDAGAAGSAADAARANKAEAALAEANDTIAKLEADNAALTAQLEAATTAAATAKVGEQK